MIIKKITAKNYRSLEDIEIEFNPYYNALSGKNNSGKSNIIKAVLSFLTYDYPTTRRGVWSKLSDRNGIAHLISKRSTSTKGPRLNHLPCAALTAQGNRIIIFLH